MKIGTFNIGMLRSKSGEEAVGFTIERGTATLPLVRVGQFTVCLWRYDVYVSWGFEYYG